MRRRCQSDDEQVGSRITEAGYAAGPVVVVLVGLAFAPDLLAPLDQSRARTTRTDLLGQRSELGGGFSLTVGHGRRLR